MDSVSTDRGQCLFYLDVPRSVVSVFYNHRHRSITIITPYLIQSQQPSDWMAMISLLLTTMLPLVNNWH
ncbi:hypothetical protein LSH36_230g03024 [Paralvinella palmiformis]|uniref:Uncharacterized protein n=1 Tax=Paralvinella palmiformis TaxID=53620 RepID=A0AAD9JPN7_9ANNE|nr:hypothetical protein LSH36_230g03024 [Paralvinella palmiformis]